MTQPTSAQHQYTSVVGVQVEDVLVRARRAGQVAAGRVQDALRLGGRARTCRGRTAGPRRPSARPGSRPRPRSTISWYQTSRPSCISQSVPLERTTMMCSRCSRSPITASTLLLDRGDLALARGAVDGDQRLGLGELHALAHRLGGEAAEHDVVHRADPRAREHRDHDLRDHPQVDPDDVALLDPEILQRVGELLHPREQVRVGDVALLALLAVPVEGDPVAEAGLDVAVEAVVGDVQLAADEPLVERRVRVVEHLVPLLEPVQTLGLAHPPALPIRFGLLIDRRVVQRSRSRRNSAGGSKRLDLEQRGELLLELVLVARRVSSCHLQSPSLFSTSGRARPLSVGRDSTACELLRYCFAVSRTGRTDRL